MLAALVTTSASRLERVERVAHARRAARQRPWTEAADHARPRAVRENRLEPRFELAERGVVRRRDRRHRPIERNGVERFDRPRVVGRRRGRRRRVATGGVRRAELLQRFVEVAAPLVDLRERADRREVVGRGLQHVLELGLRLVELLAARGARDRA